MEEEKAERKAIFETSLNNFISVVNDRIQEPRKSKYLAGIKAIRSKVDGLYDIQDLEENFEGQELRAYLKEYEALFKKAVPEIAEQSGASIETIIQNFTTKVYDPIMESLGLKPKAAKNKTSEKKEEEAIDEPQSPKRGESVMLEQNQEKVGKFVEVFIKICEKENDTGKKAADGIAADILEAAGMQTLKDAKKEYNENALKDAINKAVEKAKTITTQNKGPEKNTVKGIMMEKLKNLAKSIVSPKQAKQDKENKKSFAELEKSFAELEKLRDTIDVNPMGRV